jgi:hypothetical protein
MDQVGKYLK